MSRNVHRTFQEFSFHWAKYFISTKDENGFALLYITNTSLVRDYLEQLKVFLFLNGGPREKNSGGKEENLSCK